MIRPEDKPNFTKLVREFRTQLDAYGRSLPQRKRYDLSAYVPTAPAKIDAGFEVAKIMRDFDFVNLQGYDFHVSGETTTAQQSALFAKNDWSVDGTVKSWLRRGAPAHKLVVGMPFYGQGWTGVTGGGDGLGRLLRPGPPPPPGPPTPRTTSTSRRSPTPVRTRSTAATGTATPGSSTARPSGPTTTPPCCAPRRPTSASGASAAPWSGPWTATPPTVS